jgi:peptidoglycan/xylan/chitin deacetylase (PgdA/CDA1 family)
MKQSERVPVLMYHRVGEARNDWERRYCVSPERFADQMSYLAKKGMSACSIEDFFAWLDGKKPLREGSFLLTFDDGFLGVYEFAAPVLKHMGWTATVFLVSTLLDGQDEWSRNHNPDGNTYPLMGAKHIAALAEEGFSFQSHTRSHADLLTLSDDDLTIELEGSLQDLQALLETPVAYLAYPYGRHDERVVKATQAAGYRAAFSVQPGFNRQQVDRYRIRRLDIFGTDTPAMLARKMFFGSNEGGWLPSVRYYGERALARLSSAR